MEIVNSPDCWTSKAQLDDADNDYCYHCQHCYNHSLIGLTFRNNENARENTNECKPFFDLNRVRAFFFWCPIMSPSVVSRWQIAYHSQKTVLSFHSKSLGSAFRGCWQQLSHPLSSATRCSDVRASHAFA